MKINYEQSRSSDGFIFKAIAAVAIIVIAIICASVFIGASKKSDDSSYTSSDKITTQRSETNSQSNKSDSNKENIETAPLPGEETPVTESVPETETPVLTPIIVDGGLNIGAENSDSSNPEQTGEAVNTLNTEISGKPTANIEDYPDTMLAETEDMGQEYIDKITFLGDSTTNGLRAYKMLSGGKETTQVWTPMSGTLTLSYANVAKIVYPETNTEITIKEAVELKKPEYLVITLGVNGISFMDETEFKNEYSKLVKNIQAASPDTKIMLQSIFPVASSYDNQESINNEKIRTANKWVLDIAKECGVKYLDTITVLEDETGFLPESYQNGDGIHLCSAGFTAVLNYIRTHGYTD